MRPYYEYEHVVTFSDTNAVGNVYFASYVVWQGACRERFIAERSPGLVARFDQDLALVTVSCSCEFLAELCTFDRVSVRMSLSDIMANQVSMDFAYYRVNGGPPQLVARGNQTVACMARKDGGLVPLDVPAELRIALEPYGLDSLTRRSGDV